MSKLSKPLDIPLRGSKKSFVGIGQNILSDEENSVELVVGKPVIYSKSVKKEIEIDAIYSLSPSPVSNSFTSMSSLQSLPLEEEVSAPEQFKSEDVFLPLAPLSGSAEKNTTSVSPWYRLQLQNPQKKVRLFHYMLYLSLSLFLFRQNRLDQWYRNHFLMILLS